MVIFHSYVRFTKMMCTSNTPTGKSNHLGNLPRVMFWYRGLLEQISRHMLSGALCCIHFPPRQRRLSTFTVCFSIRSMKGPERWPSRQQSTVSCKRGNIVELEDPSINMGGKAKNGITPDFAISSLSAGMKNHGGTFEMGCFQKPWNSGLMIHGNVSWKSSWNWLVRFTYAKWIQYCLSLVKVVGQDHHDVTSDYGKKLQK